MEKDKSCWECTHHEMFIDEDEEGNLYDDGCLCYNEKAEKPINYHMTNCLAYEDKEKLTGCPYFEER